MLPLTLIALHVFLVVLWVGSIATVGWLLANRQEAPSPEHGHTAAELALGIYRRVSAPAFVAAFATGLCRVGLDPSIYLKAHWFHGKATLALVIIGLHHVIGAKAKKAAAAKPNASPEDDKTAILTGALVLCALGAIVLVVFKGALVP